MPGVHRLQHVEGFAAADLTDNDAIGAHPQCIAHEFTLRDLTDTLDVGETRL